MKVLAIALLVTILVVGGSLPAAIAQGTPTITMTRPGAGGDLIAEADDFATTVIGNPWDMSESVPPDVESTIDLNGVSIQNGIFRGTARTIDPQLILLTRGFGQADPCCLGAIHWKKNDGFVSPLNADKYHIAVVRMRLSGAGSSEGRFYWYRDDSPYSQIEVSRGFPTFDGWNTYVVDLKTFGAEVGSWAGTVRGFRFDPTGTQGATVEIDWIRLLADLPGSTNHTVQWQTANAPAGAIVDLSCSDTHGVACSVGQNIPASQGSHTWNAGLLNPGSYTINARMGTDFAALRLNDPWDMTAPSDAALENLQGNFNQTLSNGQPGFSGTSTSIDPVLVLNMPTPVDPTRFKHLTFNVRVNTSNPVARQVQVLWMVNGQWHASNTINVGTTMQQVSWDLSQYPSWSGQVTRLRLDPAAALGPGGQGVPIEVGPVTLTTSGTDRTVYTTSSPGPLMINTAPQIEITEPSMTSGPEFSASVLGDPWDMSNQQDVQRVVNSSSSMANGILSGVSFSQPLGDPQVEMNTRGQQIDTNRFRYLTYRFSMDDSMHSPQDRARDHHLKVSEGWAARVVWWGPLGPPTDVCTLSWLVVEPYPFTYTVDMAGAPIEPNSCGPQGRPWNQQPTVTQFRFDQHEVPQATGWALDDLKITGIQQASTSLQIRWTPVEPNAGQTTNVDLAHSTSSGGDNPTPIATVPAASGSYSWNIASLPRGTYYIVANIRDDLNTIRRVSAAPFTAVQAPASCTPRPNVGVKTAPSGDGRLKVTLTSSGAGNTLQSVRFEATNSALIDIPNGVTGSRGGFTQPLPGTSQTYEFFLRRETASQAATARFTVVDSCGDWTSFAGGGASAPF